VPPEQSSELVLLEQVDGLDKQLARLAAEISGAKDQLAALAAAVEQATGALAVARGEVDRQKSEERSQQRRLDELAASRKAALRVLETGVGNADAAQRQLERCDQLIDEAESNMLEVLEAQDTANRALGHATEHLAQAQRELAQGQDRLPAVIGRAEEETASLRAQRDSEYQKLPTELRARYDGFRARGRYAMARIKSGGCEACGYAVQPQMLLDLQRGRLVTCHGCHRWLIAQS
jgi:predicted  nucleic acid-binding Zn-ribbon protein